MGLSNIFAGISVFVTGLLPMSCQKHSPQSQAAPANIAAVTNSPVRDLGVVSLTNYFETQVKLGAGKSCILTPRFVGRSSVELTVSLETRNLEGKTQDLTVTQLTAQSGKPVELALGDYQLSFTPQIQ